ncbi:MAG: OsmC family protein [Acidimicrobiia bacterium]|nr:OsmC family protein [Acidimicrobiia bacterium]
MPSTATVTHVVDDKFDTSTGSGHELRVEGGDKETGPGPMELVLVALGSCSAVTVVEFLRKMRQPFTSLQVEVSGERAETAPKVYTKIRLRYLVGGDVDRGRVERAIELTESKYCSVFTMVEKTAEMSHTIEFI